MISVSISFKPCLSDNIANENEFVPSIKFASVLGIIFSRHLPFESSAFSFSRSRPLCCDWLKYTFEYVMSTESESLFRRVVCVMLLYSYYFYPLWAQNKLLQQIWHKHINVFLSVGTHCHFAFVYQPHGETKSTRTICLLVKWPVCPIISTFKPWYFPFKLFIYSKISSQNPGKVLPETKNGPITSLFMNVASTAQVWSQIAAKDN